MKSQALLEAHVANSEFATTETVHSEGRGVTLDSGWGEENLSYYNDVSPFKGPQHVNRCVVCLGN